MRLSLCVSDYIKHLPEGSTDLDDTQSRCLFISQQMAKMIPYNARAPPATQPS